MALQHYIGIKFMILMNNNFLCFTFWREIYHIFVKYNE